MKKCLKYASVLMLFVCLKISAQTQYILLKPDRVFDGEKVYEGWSVLIQKDKIVDAGPSIKFDVNLTEVINLPGTTLLPGLIEGHSHIFLHPYNETIWDDQVLIETVAERVARATNHLRASLKAGFTTMRDLGTEGIAYADVGLKLAVQKNIIPGPDLICAGPAIVATGAYAPRKFNFKTPMGADEADGSNVIQVVRKQLGQGVDVIKIYADNSWGAFGKPMPTFSIDEIKSMVQTAASNGKEVVAHATTKEGMRRAILGGVVTIEHGDEGDEEVFKMMKEHHVGWCPTLAASEAYLEYAGWKKGKDQEPESIQAKKQSFKKGLQSGVQIIFGGDVGVFTHGDNARELLLMEEYGMTAVQVLQAATSGNASAFHLEDKGRIKKGYTADLVAVKGNPIKQLRDIYRVELVLKKGIKFKD